MFTPYGVSQTIKSFPNKKRYQDKTKCQSTWKKKKKKLDILSNIKISRGKERRKNVRCGKQLFVSADLEDG